MARVLVVSTLYPNAAQPNHGVFVETRLLKTLELGGLEATVIAPAPYFPSSNPVFGRYAVYADVPPREIRRGLEVWHPRYPVLPGLPGLAPWALYGAALRGVRRLQHAGKAFDVIDAHYFFPDGVAAAQLSRTLRLPLLITGRGTDLTLIPRKAGPRGRIVRAARQASANIAVCDDLRRRLIDLGAPEDRTLTLRNGVDLELFAPGDRAAARAKFGVDGYTLVSVGALIPRKGHDLTIAALTRLPDARFLLIGAGPLRRDLEQLARRHGVADRVRFLGEIPHHELADVYRAADVSVLASDREGWANVLLESMACGAPVVSTDVNGASEVVRSPAAGLLLPDRTSEALAAGVERLRRQPPRRVETRRYAEAFGWGPIADANRSVMQAAARLGYERRHSREIVQSAERHLAAETQPDR
jgi:teichuronic acid biosynthesis glycosyltransferase TuaC